MVIVLLPLFFVVTGLRTQIGLLDRPELWLLTLALHRGGHRRQVVGGARSRRG